MIQLNCLAPKSPEGDLSRINLGYDNYKHV
ncbi:MAG: hypothetical protein JWO58_2099 [Chitinophagaceae bacterium]|nr:hypothetical protein [Chitinophagaceae bacterium]